MRDLKSQKPSRVKANRRKREREPRDWKKAFHRWLMVTVRLGSLLLVVSGGFLAAQMLFASGYFHIEKVRVSGQQRVSEEEVMALSDVQLGSNIFDIDLEMIGRKIAENSWIATAEVERAFPREVLIRVRERQPWAIINLGYLYYVDRSGEIFKVLVPADSLDYPVITGLDRQFMLERPQEAGGLIAEAMALLGALEGRQAFNLEEVSELMIDPDDGMTLFTRVGGIPIRMGEGNFATKLDRLERIYDQLEPRLLGLKYIDLNVLDRVIVKVDSRRMQGRG